MTAVVQTLPLICEASIAAQMILFASVQIAGPGRSGSLRPILAVATGSLGLAAAINLATAVGAWSGVRDLNLLLELCCVAACFLYVARAHQGAAKLSVSDLWHLAPASGVFLVWKTGLADDVDRITLAVLAAYLAACAITLTRHWEQYRPRPVLAFAVLLTASVAVLVVLRMVVMSDIALGLMLRESSAYLALLCFMAFVSSAVLIIELRHPNVLSTPQTHIKYATSGELSDSALSELDNRFRSLMDAERPFLDCELSLDDLARRLGVRARDLSQLSSRRYRMTMPALLNQWRLEEAARMLADPNNTAPVTTIMYDAGFGSKSSFQREFQKRFGVSPTAYRVRATSAR